MSDEEDDRDVFEQAGTSRARARAGNLRTFEQAGAATRTGSTPDVFKQTGALQSDED